MGLKQEILAAREHAKNFDYYQRSKCKQNLLELMAELYGEGWDPDLEASEQPQHPSKHPERQAAKTQPADPNFLKLGVFALFVKAVFTLPISSAIVESLFSKYAPLLRTPRLAAFRQSLVEAGASQVWLPALQGSRGAARQHGRLAHPHAGALGRGLATIEV